MSCPANPPPPAGYSVFRGTVSPQLKVWAVQLLQHVNKYPYGTTWQMQSNGQTIIARLDHHTWHVDAKTGKLLTNLCWPGITLYQPRPVQQGQLGGDVENVETAAPSVDLGVYGYAPTDWGLVALSAAAAAAVVAAFAAALYYAGKP